MAAIYVIYCLFSHTSKFICPEELSQPFFELLPKIENDKKALSYLLFPTKSFLERKNILNRNIKKMISF